MSSSSEIVATQDFTANQVEVDELAEQFSNMGVPGREHDAVYQPQRKHNYSIIGPPGKKHVAVYQPQPYYNYGMGMANYEDDRWSSSHGPTKELMIALVHMPDLFIAYALDERSTFAVQQLIKQAKNTNILARALALTLSTRFVEVATHRIGKHVLKQCLASIDNVYNVVLFERAIQYCLNLAIHPEGCISLNECINYITGPLRLQLLLLIAEKSAYLSCDPHGNFVVQHVLSINNEYVNGILCNNLRGQYVQLALMERSSHVVEKCINCSVHGMYLAVEEMLKKDKFLCQVTTNQYGNYVVQAALKATRVYDSELYKYLVEKLINNINIRNLRNRYAQKVVNMLRIQVTGKVENERHVWWIL